MSTDRFLKISDTGTVLDSSEPGWYAVLDQTSSLMWSIHAKQVLHHRHAKDAVESLRTAGFSDWRLPTIHEVLTIVDFDSYLPALDYRFFSSVRPAWHWTATRYLYNPGSMAWGVNLCNGEFRGLAHAEVCYVRGVRAA